MPSRILITDDDPKILESLLEIVQADGFEVQGAESAEKALEMMSDYQPDIVVSDICMAGMNGMNLLENIHQINPDIPVILMTGYSNLDRVVEAFSIGAFDYVQKPFNPEELLRLIHLADEQKKLSEGKKNSKTEMPYSASKLVGTSAAMNEVFKMIAKASLSQSHVLVLGESGTGKELVAKNIHERSQRKNNPFVAINCGALTETLLTSELFGHIKGSFTGATQNKKGLLEIADGGTLFLDEIGDMPLSLQVALLRAIQEREIKPVGSTQAIQVNVRIIAATHRDLPKLVAEGKFREDLYYRLKVLCIPVPALREHKEDILPLANYFLSKLPKHLDRYEYVLSEEAIALLQKHPWPGNVRELEHTLESATTLARGRYLLPSDFANLTTQQPEAAPTLNIVPALPDSQNTIPWSSNLKKLEKAHIYEVLNLVHQSKTKAAKLLGVSRVTLYRKLKEYAKS